jgi:mannitol-specific phosphotransferase system IIBC component
MNRWGIAAITLASFCAGCITAAAVAMPASDFIKIIAGMCIGATATASVCAAVLNYREKSSQEVL